MAKPLPRLRNDLDVMPSPAPEQPGLLLRDPYHYSAAMLIIPPVLIPALSFLDGEKTYLDLQTFLARHVGQLVSSDVVENFVRTLDVEGFLETGEFYRLQEACHEEFRNSAERKAVHAGAAYSAQPAELRTQLAEYMDSATGQPDPPGVFGIAAPHVSPVGGWKCYASAYARPAPPPAERTFVVLGTSHYGQPEKFGLTRKPFVTPLGTLEADTSLVDWLAERAGEAVLMEDYCHAIEHSIEFQCIFLQHALGPRCRILPILCGPFLESLLTGEAPESDAGVKRFFEALGELAEREGSRLFWILGIDLTHIGKRYGDPFSVQAENGRMAEVRKKDLERLGRVCAGDGPGFLELVRPQGDELRWCGYSALYTFLKAVPGARANILNYEQWNIDEESVVSFAALEFFREGVAKPRA
ncbi:MAG: AmmeMemoRadiSam system protein B [Acidobacteria bacterium]|nr:AmmeMemoRadiSam system protein B [Acidobacteriota bacterium]